MRLVLFVIYQDVIVENKLTEWHKKYKFFIECMMRSYFFKITLALQRGNPQFSQQKLKSTFLKKQEKKISVKCLKRDNFRLLNIWLYRVNDASFRSHNSLILHLYIGMLDSQQHFLQLGMLKQVVNFVIFLNENWMAFDFIYT